jgi:hypothetical protein
MILQADENKRDVLQDLQNAGVMVLPGAWDEDTSLRLADSVSALNLSLGVDGWEGM